MREGQPHMRAWGETMFAIIDDDAMHLVRHHYAIIDLHVVIVAAARLQL